MDSLECRFPAHANHSRLLWLSAADKNKYGTKVTWNALFVPKSFCFWSLMAPGIVYGPLHYFRPNCPIRNVLRRLSHFLGTPPKSEGKVPGASSRLPVCTRTINWNPPGSGSKHQLQTWSGTWHGNARTRTRRRASPCKNACRQHPEHLEARNPSLGPP